MALVLAGVLGSSLYGSYKSQAKMIENALSHAETDFGFGNPGMGPRMFDPNTGIMAMSIDVASDGVVLKGEGTPEILDNDTVEDILEDAFEDDGEDEVFEGKDDEHHIVWRRVETDIGWRILMVDTFAFDTNFQQTLRNDILIFCGATFLVALLSWLLSALAMKPVAATWEQQRRFVSDASHELKTPLSVIMANNQILAQEVDGDEKLTRWIESTREETNSMANLINELLELAQADEAESSTAFVKQPINLSEMLESTVLEYDAIAYERNCTIDSQVESGVNIEGDPSQIERLLKILIDNATKYADEGTSVKVSLAKAGGHSKLTVTNFGNPIDDSDIEHVFERFYRSDKARSRDESSGFGLGLAIAKGIVDAHGGSISVESSKSSGTSFSVLL